VGEYMQIDQDDLRDIMAERDALAASCREFLPILERQLASINPDRAAEASSAFQVAKARVDRMRAALTTVDGSGGA
jgi:hypothetical protein